jgi:hypothetical protein
MMNVGQPFPDFADPPVVEVALSVQFDPLSALRTPQIGLLWAEYRTRFPNQASVTNWLSVAARQRRRSWGLGAAGIRVWFEPRWHGPCRCQ